MAVIESHTNIAVAKAGTKASTRPSLTPDKRTRSDQEKYGEEAEDENKRQPFLRWAR